MTQRKYFTECGIDIYIDECIYMPVDLIYENQDNPKFNIYMILTVPKMFLEYNNNKDILNCSIIDIYNNKFNFKDINFFNLFGAELKNSQYRIKTQPPYDRVTITSLKGKDLDIPIHFLYNAFNNLQYKLKLEYIGQSKGTKNKKGALSRLINHETLQEILVRENNKHDIYILLASIGVNISLNMDGISKNIKYRGSIDDSHFKKIIQNKYSYKQIINLAEAALINFFKPKYNIYLKENFPSKKHTSYKEYYDLDFNSIRLSLKLSIPQEQFYPIIFTKHRILDTKNVMQPITYNLFDKNNRKSMYDIFKKRE